jgi:hypothetical protein
MVEARNVKKSYKREVDGRREKKVGDGNIGAGIYTAPAPNARL